MTGSPGIASEICSFLKGNCKHILGPRFWDVRRVCRVDAGLKADKVDSKYLVLSKFRFFFLLGKAASKLQVETHFHLLQIQSIEVVGENHVRLSLDGRALYIYPGDEGVTASSLAHDFLCAFKHYFPECAVRRFIELVPVSLYTDYGFLTDRAPTLPAGGFRRTYAALCDFHKLSYYEEVAWDIEKIYAIHDNRTLRLEDFDHLSSKDLVPIIGVLEFSSWFTGLSVHNSSSTIKFTGELLDSLIRVLRKNQSLVCLELVNCGLKPDFLISFGNAIAVNGSLPLRQLNLSKNNFEDNSKALSHFASNLVRLETSLQLVDLSDCNLGCKCVNLLCRSIQTHAKTIDHVTSLNLSGNILKDADLLSDLHQLISRCSALKELDLSRSGLALEKLYSALIFGGLELSKLCLSGCVFSYRKSKDVTIPNFLKTYFNSVIALRVLDLSFCNLPPEVLKQTLLQLACNQQLAGLELNLSGSCTDKQFLPVLETCLDKLSCVESLILRDNCFGDDLSVILSTITKMPCLRKLDVSGNNFSNVRPRQIPNLLMEIVKILNDDEKEFQDLILADCRLGSGLSVVINALGVCPHLRRLDLSGNGIKDSGARLLAKALQVNGSLRTLLIDRNQITVCGFRDLANALEQNYSLVELSYPVADVVESFNKDKESTEAVLLQIQHILFRNSGGSNGDCDRVNRSLQAQSKIMIGNLEEELNKHVNIANRLFEDYNWDPESDDVQKLKYLLEDAEKTKVLIPSLLDVCGGTDFIASNVSAQLRELQEQMKDSLEKNVRSMLKYPEADRIAVWSNDELQTTIKDCCKLKTNLDLNFNLNLFCATLKQTYNSVNLNVATLITEKIVQEIISQMSLLEKHMTTRTKSASISSNSSTTHVASDCKSPGTPKHKRKFKVFGGRSRPKSIVDGMIDSVESTDQVASSAAFDSSIDRSSLDNMSVDSGETVDELPQLVVEGKLVHIQKTRPRRSKNVRSSVPVVNNLSFSKPSSTDADEGPVTLDSWVVVGTNGMAAPEHQKSPMTESSVPLLPPERPPPPRFVLKTPASATLCGSEPLPEPAIETDSKQTENEAEASSTVLPTLAPRKMHVSPPPVITTLKPQVINKISEKLTASEDSETAIPGDIKCMENELHASDAIETSIVQLTPVCGKGLPETVANTGGISDSYQRLQLSPLLPSTPESAKSPAFYDASSSSFAAPSVASTQLLAASGEPYIQTIASDSASELFSSFQSDVQKLDQDTTNGSCNATVTDDNDLDSSPMTTTTKHRSGFIDELRARQSAGPGTDSVKAASGGVSSSRSFVAFPNTTTTNSVASPTLRNAAAAEENNNRKSMFSETPPRPTIPNKPTVVLRNASKGALTSSVEQISGTSSVLASDQRPKSVVADLKAQFEVCGPPKPPVRPRRQNKIVPCASDQETKDTS